MAFMAEQLRTRSWWTSCCLGRASCSSAPSRRSARTSSAGGGYFLGFEGVIFLLYCVLAVVGFFVGLVSGGLASLALAGFLGVQGCDFACGLCLVQGV